MSTIQRRIGKYELQERLGRGGMAEVWKALDTKLQRYVAIKLLHSDLQNDPDFLKRFEREARVVASLRHPNIVQVHDFQIARPPDAEETIAYMVMEYIEGLTLADYIDSTSRAGNFPSATEMVHLFASISTAVDYAHRKGMIHRDIKPANILLDKNNTAHNPRGEPILTDFGIAKLIGTSTGTLSGSWVSTPLYISPEQVRGNPGNERSDLYALGIILYEICTGTLPFQGGNPNEVMMQHINATVQPPHLINPNVSPALSAVIMRSLARDPADRFPSASAMTAALAQAFDVPVPENLNTSTGEVDAIHSLTPLSSTQTASPVNLTPIISSPFPSAAPMPSAQFILASSSTQTPSQLSAQTPFVSSSPTILPRAQSSLPATPLQPTQPPIVPTPIPAPKKKRRGMLLALVLLLLVAIVGSGLGVFFLLPHGGTLPTDQVVGQSFFVSSGQLNETNSEGLSDELQINLQNIPAPGVGKSYYAWLLGDKACDLESNNPGLQCDPKDPKHERLLHPAAPILLGRLSFNNGNVRFLYPGNKHNTNLISFASRLVITEENTKGTPVTPSSPWRFYAELPQAPYLQSASQLSAIHGIRGLLYDTHSLKALGIRGGLDIRFLRNTQKILEFADSAEDAWRINPGLLHRQVVRILDYIDGISYAKKDVPAGTPLLADPRLSALPLLILFPLVNADRNYQSRMVGHFQEIIDGPDTSAATRALATQLIGEVNYTQKWFTKVRQDAKQLVLMNSAQLYQPLALSLLIDMQTQANYALIGQIDPTTGKMQPGVVHIHYSIQLLAAFTIRAYSPH